MKLLKNMTFMVIMVAKKNFLKFMYLTQEA